MTVPPPADAALAQAQTTAAAPALLPAPAPVGVLRDQNALLVSLAERLAAAATVHEVAAAITTAATDILGATWSYIGLEDTSAGLLRLVPVQGRPGDDQSQWLSLPLGLEHPPCSALHAGAPVLLTDADVTLQRFPGTWSSTDGPVPFQASAHLPLTTASGVAGTLSLVWDHRRTFEEDTQRFLVSVARFVGLSVSRALLLDERQQAAATMQRALLSDLPQVEHLQLAARYRPASTHDHVGGDWYDAFTDARGALVLVIGDVVGHDLAAAAAMGQLRSLLRACAWEGDLEPGQVLDRLDRTAWGLGGSCLATVVLARIEPTGRGAGGLGGDRGDRGDRGAPDGEEAVLAWSSAGHLDPVVLSAGGTVLGYRSEPGLLLGVDPTTVRVTQRQPLPEGATVLLYTDGLVERRGEHLQDSIDALMGRLPALAGLELEELLDGVLAPVRSQARDDVALLAARLEGGQREQLNGLSDTAGLGTEDN